MSSDTPDPLAHAKHHLQRTLLEARLAALPAAPSRTGTLHLIVARRPDGRRETPDRVRLSVEDGVPGDAWGRGQPKDSEAQITVMRRDVATVIADGRQPTLFGDNLFVDLDIAAANMPIGRRWRVGDAVVEVSPKPHNGCLKFRDRFGPDALLAVQARETRHQNRRGVYWRVVESGDAWVGAPIEALGGAAGYPARP